MRLCQQGCRAGFLQPATFLDSINTSCAPQQTWLARACGLITWVCTCSASRMERVMMVMVGLEIPAEAKTEAPPTYRLSTPWTFRFWSTTPSVGAVEADIRVVPRW